MDGLERNLCQNGNFDFWQRGTVSSSFTIDSGTHYNADRFYHSVAGPTVTINQSSQVPTLAQSGYNSLYSLLVTVSAPVAAGTSNSIQIGQRLEGQDYQAIHGKPFRLQFWVKTSVAGTYSIAFRNSAVNRSYIATYTITSGQINGWQKIIIDLTADTAGTWAFDNTIGLRIDWMLSLGTSSQTSSLNTWFSSNFRGSTTQVDFGNVNAATWQITQVQIIPQDFTQAGSSTVDIPFQRAGRTIGDELRMCQRYYEKSYDLDVVPGTNGAKGFNTMALAIGPIAGSTAGNSGSPNSLQYSVTKRTTPTLVLYDFDGTANAVRVNPVNAKRSGIIGVANAGIRGGFQFLTFDNSSSQAILATDSFGFHWTAESEL